MKKLFALLLALVMVLSLAACGEKPADTTPPADGDAPVNTPADDTVYQISVAITQPAEAYAGRITGEYCAKMEEASGGRLDIEVYYSGTLVPVTDALTAVADGFADIAFIPSNLGTDYFPISSKLLSMPFMGYPSTEAANNAYATIRAEFPELDAEYEQHNIKNLGAYVMGRNDLYFNEVIDVATPADLKGLKVGVSSAFMTNYMKEAGAAPVFITNADMYTAMDNGVVQGLAQHLALMKSTSTIDTVESVTFLGDSGLLRDLGIFGMNLDKYNSLPADLQQILMDGFVEMCEATWKEDEIQRDGLVKLISDSGAKITTLSEEQMDAWMASAKPLHDAMIAELAGQGVPAQAIYDRVQELNSQG